LTWLSRIQRGEGLGLVVSQVAQAKALSNAIPCVSRRPQSLQRQLRICVHSANANKHEWPSLTNFTQAIAAKRAGDSSLIRQCFSPHRLLFLLLSRPFLFAAMLKAWHQQGTLQPSARSRAERRAVVPHGRGISHYEASSVWYALGGCDAASA
jgi:hypothetical protein